MNLLSQANVQIVGLDFALAEPTMLQACLVKASQYLRDGVMIELRCQPRKPDGWLEWGMIVPKFYLACIQRKPGEEVEFCS